MVTVRLARMAMASRFELVLQGDDETRLRAAGEEALAEIGRLDAQMSFYRPSSEISRINANASAGPVRVEPRLFRLLQQAQRISEATQGAFDVTVAPLMRCWGFVNDTGRMPDPESVAEARQCTGMHLVELNRAESTIRFARPGVLIDLGAIGKGYAVDEAIQILRELGVDRAFLHGGTSAIYGLGRPLDAEAWKVAIPPPGGDADARPVAAIVALEDEALSVSAVWGKSFVADGQTFGHVLDPRTGRPVEGAVLTAVVLPSATESDALSTALLVLGPEATSLMLSDRPDMRALVAYPDIESDPPGFHVIRHRLTSKTKLPLSNHFLP